MSQNTIDTAIYIHWPFCKSKCPYCDFNVRVHDTIDQKAWKDSYIKSIKYYAEELLERRIVSVFFGGGTPSLMPADTVEGIIQTIKDSWPVADDIEITLEANPTSVEAGKFKAFREAGINRVSLGVQSLRDEQLKFLGRTHDADEAIRAIHIAQNIFDRMSFDLIYARPGQTLPDWETELREAVELAKGHLSLYQLTIERSTPFYMDHARGKFTLPGQELAADFYALTQDIMEGAGLPAYEVSNHAASGHQSRHNRVYWEYGDYIGIGPGAHGRLSMNVGKVAIRDHSAPEVWIERVEKSGHGAHPPEILPPRDRFIEALMMGLRLREGVSRDHLREKSGADLHEVLNEEKIRSVIREGWMADDLNHLRLTREGWLRLNAIVPFILKGET
ncbi:MAG: radical SAM family heme chaperone HemW [Alphaproteobacteria bacterium]